MHQIKILSQRSRSSLPFWFAGIAVGATSSLYAIAFKKFAGVSLDLFGQHQMLWMALVPVGFVTSYALVKFFSPGSSGSGIPQILAVLNQIDEKKETTEKFVSFLMIPIKILSSLSAVIVGGAIGREGPTIQIGAGLFHWIDSKKKQKSRRQERKAFVIAGAAAGLAAAFNTPLGGIVFAIEELARDHFRLFRVPLLLSVILAGISAQSIVGQYLYLGKFAYSPIDFVSIAHALLVGVAGGLCGAVFGRVLYRLCELRSKIKGNTKNLLFIVALSAIFVLIALFTQGKTLGPGIEDIGTLMKNPNGDESHFFLLRWASTQLSYIVGGAGGIFSPSLTLGGQLGALLGVLIHAFPGQITLMIALGMVSFLTGVSYAPFTSLVLVLEMTDTTTTIFPMLLTALTAHGVAKLVHEHSFYERMCTKYLGEVSGSSESVNTQHH